MTCVREVRSNGKVRVKVHDPHCVISPGNVKKQSLALESELAEDNTILCYPKGMMIMNSDVLNVLLIIITCCLIIFVKSEMVLNLHEQSIFTFIIHSLNMIFVSLRLLYLVQQ